MSGQPSTRGSIAGWQSLGNPGNGRECRVTWSNETTCRPVVVMPQGAGSTGLASRGVRSNLIAGYCRDRRSSLATRHSL